MSSRRSKTRNAPASDMAVAYTDHDILLKRGGLVSKREANQFYHSLLQANVMVYKSLPKDLRSDFARNIISFILGPCQRKLIQYQADTDDYIELDVEAASPAVSAAIRDDRVAQACCSSNPLWILGLHGTAGSDGLPYAYYKQGTWCYPGSMDELRQFLLTHGIQNMIILPPEFQLPELGPKQDARAVESVDYVDSMLQEMEMDVLHGQGSSKGSPGARRTSTSSEQTGVMTSFSNFEFQESEHQFPEDHLPGLSRVVSATPTQLFRKRRLSALRRSCSTISLSDIEDEDMDENFQGFEFAKPDLFNSSEMAMQYFLGESVATMEV